MVLRIQGKIKTNLIHHKYYLLFISTSNVLFQGNDNSVLYEVKPFKVLNDSDVEKAFEDFKNNENGN